MTDCGVLAAKEDLYRYLYEIALEKHWPLVGEKVEKHRHFCRETKNWLNERLYIFAHRPVSKVTEIDFH